MMMAEFYEFLLDDTLEEAREKQLCGICTASEFQAVAQAVVDCRQALQSHQMVITLRHILNQARIDTKLSDGMSTQLYWITREATIEWVASVFSVALAQFRIPAIVEPSRAAVLTAARLATPGAPQPEVF